MTQVARQERFNFRLDTDEKKYLAEIARRLERSESDALRWLIRQAHRELARGLEPARQDRGQS